MFSVLRARYSQLRLGQEGEEWRGERERERGEREGEDESESESEE